MKVEHYLTSVSAAIEAHETRMGEEFEAYADAIRRADVSMPNTMVELDAVFMARLGRSYLDMVSTMNNLLKWPRT